jgi:hypothetical protein
MRQRRALLVRLVQAYKQVLDLLLLRCHTVAIIVLVLGCLGDLDLDLILRCETLQRLRGQSILRLFELGFGALLGFHLLLRTYASISLETTVRKELYLPR